MEKYINKKLVSNVSVTKKWHSPITPELRNKNVYDLVLASIPKIVEQAHKDEANIYETFRWSSDSMIAASRSSSSDPEIAFLTATIKFSLVTALTTTPYLRIVSNFPGK